MVNHLFLWAMASIAMLLCQAGYIQQHLELNRAPHLTTLAGPLFGPSSLSFQLVASHLHMLIRISIFGAMQGSTHTHTHIYIYICIHTFRYRYHMYLCIDVTTCLIINLLGHARSLRWPLRISRSVIFREIMQRCAKPWTAIKPWNGWMNERRPEGEFGVEFGGWICLGWCLRV